MQTMTSLERYYAAQVAAIAGRTFAKAIDPAVLRAYANRAVAELLRGEARLTAFVPELALRTVREALDRDRVANFPIAGLPATYPAA